MDVFDICFLINYLSPHQMVSSRMQKHVFVHHCICSICFNALGKLMKGKTC